MQKPKPTDFDNEQDYLNNWAGWQINTGSWSEPVPTDWKAPVVTPPTPVAQTSPQPDGMLTNTTKPRMTVEPTPQPEPVAQASSQPDGMITNTTTPRMAVEPAPQPVEPSMESFSTARDYSRAYNQWWRKTSGGADIATAPVPKPWRAWTDANKAAPVAPTPVAQTRPQPDGMLTNTTGSQMAVEGDPQPEAVASVPRPADYSSETDFLNAVAGYRVNTGEYNLTPDDYSAWGKYQDSLLTPTEDTYEAPPADYVPEYVKPETTQIEDLFSNELGGSTEADDPFAIDVEAEDTYVAPPADYVPEYIEPVETATGYREEDDVTSSPEVSVGTATGYREDGDVTSSPEVSEDADPFADYARLSTENQIIDASYSDDPDTYLNTTDASGLPFMEYTPEMMESVTFDDPSRLGDYTNFGGRLISGDSEEYEAAFTFNNLLSRGIDEQTALDWFDNDGTAAGANKILSDTYFEKQDAVVSELNNSIELDNIAKFKGQYSGLDFEGKIGFLHDQLKQENITQEEYEQLWRDEWNASQAGSDNPNYIVQIDAPRDWDAGQGAGIYQDEYSPKYQAGDKIWITTDGKEILGVVRSNTYAPNEVNADRKLQYYDNIGPMTENIPDQSTWMDVRESVLKPGLRVALAAATGGTSEKLYTAYKIATGETLNASDYVNIVVGGLEATGVIAPPVDIDGDMVNPIGGGTVGGQLGNELLLGGPLTDGVGLYGLDYTSTVGVLNAAINQDAIGVIAAGTGWMQQGFESLGVPSSVASDVDFLKAARETMDMLANGESVQDSMEAGFERYIKEGGGFGIELDDGGFFDFDFGVVGDAFNYVADAVGTVSSTLGDYIDPALQGAVDIGQDASSALGDYLDPVLAAVADAAAPAVNVADDIIDATGDVIDDAVDVVADFAEPIVNTADDIIDATGDVIDDTVDVVADTFEPLVDAADDIIDATGDVIDDLGDALPDLNLGLPNLNLGLNLPSMGMMSGTRTTDSLFNKELFKFKTKIGVSPQEQLIQATPRKQQKQEYADLFEDPFASTFNFKV